jgi:SNF2 family DNA or RNA helicase
MSEWLEWLEIPQQANLRANPAAPPPPPDVSSKRCPQCGWLDHSSVTECFRCGDNYLAPEEQHAATLKSHPLGIPAPIVHQVEFDAWNFGKKRGATPLLKVGTDDATRAAAPLTEFFLRLQAEQHALAVGFDRLIALNGLPILHYDHQLHTALKVLNTMRGQALLADEVGLGKTIEAGIILKELLARGLVKRVLIITPASLMGQWRDELQAKFNEEFSIATTEADWRQEKVITSFSRLRFPKTKTAPAPANVILQQEYDLLIIDEAHKLKHRSTQRFKFVSKIKKKYVLMLTATPVHNDLTELYNLITILKPGLLGTIRSFKQHFVASSDARRPKNEPQLKKLLASVMIRNRRRDVNIQFPERKSAIYHLALTDKERELYEGVSEYIRHEFKTQTSHQFHLLSLTTLQKELCSSSRAVQATLEKMAGREHYPEATKTRLRSYVALASEITMNRKLEALLDILAKFPGKFLIFTEFIQTMNYIKEHLEAAGMSVQLFHGGMDLLQRRDAIRRFADSTRIMISTQTGGEGANLQFCHQLVNYDLPWNPMMVEQRIGRLHRLGQMHDVAIFNLSVEQTIEAHVLDLLARKIRMFELVVGELDLILSESDEKKTFEHTIQEIWLDSKDEADMRRRFDQFGRQLTQMRKEFEKIKETETLTSELFEENES